MFKTIIAKNKAYFENAAGYYRRHRLDDECTVFGVMNIMSTLCAIVFGIMSALRLFGDDVEWMPKALAYYGFIQFFVSLGLQVVYINLTDTSENLKDSVNVKMVAFVTYTASLVSWSAVIILAFCSLVDFFALFLYYIPKAVFTHTEKKKETKEDKIKCLIKDYGKLY